MKISEVPQDDIKTLKGVKKALYAIDDQGCYAKTTTRGWEVEEVVLSQVIGDFDEKARETASWVRNNETSTIEYFMYKNWMTGAGDMWRRFASACAKACKSKTGDFDVAEIAQRVQKCAKQEKHVYSHLKLMKL